jgi:hypothetical protein
MNGNIIERIPQEIVSAKTMFVPRFEFFTSLGLFDVVSSVETQQQQYRHYW